MEGFYLHLVGGVIYPLLKRLVGGVKKMLNYLLSQGSIYLPIGLILLLLALEKEGYVATGFFIFGGLAVILGLSSMQKAWNYIRKKEIEEITRQKERDKKQDEMFAELINEIKKI